MDSYLAMLEYHLKDFDFKPTRYQVYRGNELIECGDISASISVISQDDLMHGRDGGVYVNIKTNDPMPQLDKSVTFDKFITLPDKIMFLIFPETTNANLSLLQLFDVFEMLSHTREVKFFGPSEPVCAFLFTENGNPVKMSFTTINPEREIEFF